MLEKKKKSIIIIEDEPAIAEDLVDIVELAGYNVIDVQHDFKSGMDAILNKTFDLALLDINLGNGQSGLEIAKKIKYDLNKPFVFVTSYADDDTIQSVVKLQPAGYIIKPFKERDIVATIALAFSKITNNSSAQIPSKEKIDGSIFDKLSGQEYTILNLLWEGHANKEIASILFISPNTVKSHIYNLFGKLGVKSRLQAVQKLKGI